MGAKARAPPLAEPGLGGADEFSQRSAPYPRNYAAVTPRSEARVPNYADAPGGPVVAEIDARIGLPSLRRALANVV